MPRGRFTQGCDLPTMSSMSIIENKRRRELLLLGGSSFLAATALATLGVPMARAASARETPMQGRRGDRGRFESIDEALAQGVSNGTVAGVVAVAADRQGAIYEGAYGKRDLDSAAGMTQDT